MAAVAATAAHSSAASANFPAQVFVIALLMRID
jgi:hypothetical protein